MEISDFTFLVSHFTATSYFSPVIFFTSNFFSAHSRLFQQRVSLRNGFFTSNIFGGIRNDSSLCNGVMKSQMTLWINHRGYPALLHFTVIALISMSKFDAIFRDLWKSLEMVFRLYLFGILETQGTEFLFSFRHTCIVNAASLLNKVPTIAQPSISL